MNLDKDPSSWARINPVIVANWHPTEVQNFVAMALGDIAKLAAEVERLQKQCTGMANAALSNGQGLILYERALIKIKELAASEADEPLDEAIKIATDALGFTSPELQFDERP